MFKNKILLITGGTGSFGNVVLRRFLKTNIKEIRIFSRDELKQDDMRKKYNNSKLKFYLGNVRDINSIKDVVKNVDLHIGYRVHAHIFMNSVSKFSILISEDGRAKGVKGVIGGIVLDGFNTFKDSFIAKVLNKLFDSYDRFTSNKYLKIEIINELDYEIKTNYNRFINSRQQIDNNFNIMKQFIEQLP